MNRLPDYELLLAPARTRLDQSRWVAEILAPSVAPERLERFLIHFCSLGVKMTEPVEGWIRRAGERCVAIGLTELGEALRSHARHEAGHQEMMVRDTEALVQRRRRAGRPAPDAASLIGRDPSAGMRQYIGLHEDTIAGASPFVQVAIEYEIERMSTTHGPSFIRRCVDTLGADVRSCLSFVQDHVALDVGHTRFNAKQLDALLVARPDALPALVTAGSAALAAYSAFFDDCIRLADEAWPTERLVAAAIAQA